MLQTASNETCNGRLHVPRLAHLHGIGQLDCCNSLVQNVIEPVLIWVRFQYLPGVFLALGETSPHRFLAWMIKAAFICPLRVAEAFSCRGAAER